MNDFKWSLLCLLGSYKNGNKVDRVTTKYFYASCRGPVLYCGLNLWQGDPEQAEITSVVILCLLFPAIQFIKVRLCNKTNQKCQDWTNVGRFFVSPGYFHWSTRFSLLFRGCRITKTDACSGWAVTWVLYMEKSNYVNCSVQYLAFNYFTTS